MSNWETGVDRIDDPRSVWMVRVSQPGVEGVDQRSPELVQRQAPEGPELLVDDPPVLDHRFRRPVLRRRGHQVPIPGSPMCPRTPAQQR